MRVDVYSQELRHPSILHKSFTAMKDALLVGPILVVGGFLLSSLSSADSRHESMRGEQMVFLGFLFLLLFTWYRGKQSAAERLRALELGRTLPDLGPVWSVGKVVATVAIGVPVALIGVIWTTSFSPYRDSPAIWITTAFLGMTTLICGTILVLKLAPASTAGLPGDRRPVLSKLPIDPDAFDVVAQRGSNGLYPEERS